MGAKPEREMGKKKIQCFEGIFCGVYRKGFENSQHLETMNLREINTSYPEALKMQDTKIKSAENKKIHNFTDYQFPLISTRCPENVTKISPRQQQKN